MHCGPCTVCEWNPEWDSLLPDEQARLKARQGVKYVCLDGLQGYLNNPDSGDLAVWHPNGYIKIKDRAKDIIISGGENISNLEVESILYRHPAVLEAAVVAQPDEQWSMCVCVPQAQRESPCAFVSLKHGVRSNEEILLLYRQHLPKFMVPKSIVILTALDKTATGKIQKQVLCSKARALGSVK
ncbi:acetate/butyrate--CoA ligase AAE7, peroxisomal [Selaginella moellendorffii]|uniref:acetate/butyrate--CoA ligase AAE7, peroxisomal n=1 Tax=Selaginella moellendorffii TaxID=88036 RepID=UPI000D1CB9E4|nr:acetate/butyrate--CoA ligase AAE7, peroxisomal [Selaginella moellendorffii]|eukprot:XP_024523706.1 acetate/butyrate--CoA ligase AAE7, peroxisomal [Selaginella moellendorffii]